MLSTTVVKTLADTCCNPPLCSLLREENLPPCLVGHSHLPVLGAAEGDTLVQNARHFSSLTQTLPNPSKMFCHLTVAEICLETSIKVSSTLELKLVKCVRKMPPVSTLLLFCYAATVPGCLFWAVIQTLCQKGKVISSSCIWCLLYKPRWFVD